MVQENRRIYSKWFRRTEGYILKGLGEQNDIFKMVQENRRIYSTWFRRTEGYILNGLGEQKDMAEFFIDLLSKMEEMSVQLKVGNYPFP